MTQLSDFDPKSLTRASAILIGIAGAYFDIRRRHSIDPRNRELVMRDQKDMEHLLEFVNINMKEIYG